MVKKSDNINNRTKIISMLVLGWVMTAYAISERIIATNESADRNASIGSAAPRIGNITDSEFGGTPRNLGAEYNQWLYGALRDGVVERN